MTQIKRKRKIKGTSLLPRLSVFRSNKYLYAQVVDDEKGITLLGVSEKSITAKGAKLEKAKALGDLVAKKALQKKVEKVVFDRGNRAYHGLIKAVAEGAREGGLQF